MHVSLERDDRDSDDHDAVVDAVLSASRALVAIAARSLADAGEEVTLTQYRSLIVLASHGPQSVATLAQRLGVTPSTASRLCDRLVRKRLVVRRTDRTDRRQTRLGLSQNGRQLVDAVTRRRREEIAALLGSMPVDEQASLAASLARLAEAAGEVPERDWRSGWGL